MAKSQYGIEYSKELIALKEDFESFTHMEVVSIDEHPSYFHWKRLILGYLNCDELENIAKYIRSRFTTEGKYTHLQPSIQVRDGHICLVVDASQINTFILKNTQQ